MEGEEEGEGDDWGSGNPWDDWEAPNIIPPSSQTASASGWGLYQRWRNHAEETVVMRVSEYFGWGSCAGASRGVRPSVRTFVEAPAASPAEDDQPHKEKAQGEEATGDSEDTGEGGAENFVISKL